MPATYGITPPYVLAIVQRHEFHREGMFVTSAHGMIRGRRGWTKTPQLPLLPTLLRAAGLNVGDSWHACIEWHHGRRGIWIEAAPDGAPRAGNAAPRDD